MEIRHCRYFLAVLEAGNITKAAARLGMSQPSLSQHIAYVEKRLDAKLFDRTKNGIKLTPAGEIFLPHARGLVEAIEQSRVAVARGQRLLNGRVRIAVVSSLMCTLAPVVASFLELYPGISIEVLERPRREIDKLILAGEIEVGFGAKRVSPPEINANLLYKESYVLAFHKDHRFAREKIDKLNAIGSIPFGALAFGTFARDELDRYLSQIRFSPNICFESELLSCILEVIAASEMCAVLPRQAVVNRSDLAHHELSKPKLIRNVAILTHRSSSSSSATTQFIELLSQRLKSDDA